MKSGNLVFAALMSAVVLAGAAHGEKRRAISPPAPKRPPGTVPTADPAEPPLAVRATFDNAGAGGAPEGGWPARPVAVAGGPKGTTLTLETPGLWQGRAALTFKGAAPPMRFGLRLLKMQSYDLESLTLTSGRLSLAVGPVSAGVTTRHFDARGRVQDTPESAAYTVTARRWDGGEVEVQVRRSRGASLGKELAVSWRSSIGYDWGGLGDK